MTRRPVHQSERTLRPWDSVAPLGGPLTTLGGCAVRAHPGSLEIYLKSLDLLSLEGPRGSRIGAAREVPLALRTGFLPSLANLAAVVQC